MTLRRVPASILLALGLQGCGDDDDDETETVNACLFCAPEECNTDTGTTEATGTESSGGSTDTSTGTSTDGSTSGVDTSDVGPCLAPELDSSSSDSTGDGTGTGDETTGSGLADDEWSDAFERVSAKLPADVAARLGRRNPGGGT